jgi:histidinol-phosphate aminotransferase
MKSGMIHKLDLSKAEGTIRVPQELLRKTVLSAKELAVLPSREGREQLRVLIANLYSCRNDNVVLGNGSDELIEGIARVLAGGISLTVVPTFERLYEVNLKLGYRAYTVSLDKEQSFTYSPATHQAVLNEISQLRPSVVWLCSPSNPTGAIIPSRCISEIAVALPNGIVVVDMAFADIAAGQVDTSLAPLVDRHKNLVLLNSFSKSWGLAGLRLGFALANPGLAKRLNEYTVMFNINSLALAVAMASITYESYRSEAFTRIHDNTELLKRELAALQKFECISNANIGLIMLRHKRYEDLHSKLLEKGIKTKKMHDYPGLDMGFYCRIQVPRTKTETRTLVRVLSSIK